MAPPTSTPEVAWREECADRIANELRLAPSRSRLAKASSLLHAFRTPGAHIEARDVKQTLEARGVLVRSPRPEISRRDVLELCPVDSPVGTGTGTASAGIRASRWLRGEAGREQVPLSTLREVDRKDGEILWFDVDPADVRQGDEPVHERVDHVTAALSPWCPGLDEVMVRDLLIPDIQPKIETYGDERTGVRSISMAAVITREVPDTDDDFDGVDEQLIIQMVEVLCGPSWIVTCWHPCRVLVGGGRVIEAPSLVREPFLSHVAYRWLNDDVDRIPAGKQPGDLGLYLARSLVATYGASLRMLQRWVSTWEVSFYAALKEDHGGKKLKDAAVELSNFLSMVAEFTRSVTAFKLAGEEMPNETWFPEPADRPTVESSDVDAVQAKTLAAAIDSAESKLRRLSEEIRGDMDLLMIQSQARQQESSERLQGYLGKVTGLVLVPTFVAGLYGANTALPGGGSWMGFDIMLVLMVLSAAISYLVIRRIMTG